MEKKFVAVAVAVAVSAVVVEVAVKGFGIEDVAVAAVVAIVVVVVEEKGSVSFGEFVQQQQVPISLASHTLFASPLLSPPLLPLLFLLQ